MSKSLMQAALTAVICTSCILFAQDTCDEGEEGNDSLTTEDGSTYSYDEPPSLDDNNNSYPTYSYDDSNRYESMNDTDNSIPTYGYEYNNYDNYRLRISRSYDNSDTFSSGVSSYQGTSTGPGPNGGYPGTPRGTYQTYYNTSNNSDYYNSPVTRRY